MAFKKGHMAWLGELAARRKSRKGEDNISYNPELASLAEGPEVFEAGYVDPRAKNYEAKLPAPPMSTAPAVVAPIVAAQDFAKNYQTNLESDPEYKKLKEIEEMDSLIEQDLNAAKEVFDRRTGEGPLPSEAPVPTPSPAQQSNEKSNENKASELTDVLKEMNKAVKMMMPQFGPEQKPKPFNPEGSQYDYKTANKIGGMFSSPDGHYFSRDPESGMILKGRSHDTFNKTVEGETQAGNVITQGEDGRYYSNPPTPTPAAPSYENLILSNDELLNIGAMTLDNIPTDRMYVLTGSGITEHSA